VRIWSLCPSYLDRQGLGACWRESLLAQAVLAERTRGYRSHPQLERFRGCEDPLGSICWYLHAIADEADARGYLYDRSRIDRPAVVAPTIEVTTGQLEYEWTWLRHKLAARSPDALSRWADVVRPAAHRSFVAVDGPVEKWERILCRLESPHA
jgi:hypothetical protein